MCEKLLYECVVIIIIFSGCSLMVSARIRQFSQDLIRSRGYKYRGYYTAVRRYGFYFRVVKTIFYERAQRVSKILLFTTRT